MNGPALPGLPAGASPGSARAVLIGAAAYASGDLRPIPHSRRNVRALAKVLTEEATGGLTPWDVLTVDDPRQSEDIMRPVWAAAEEAEDALLVYYSGHGLVAADGAFHLALTTSHSGKDWTSLPYFYVADLIRKSRARVKIVILDCCFSGRGHAGLMSSESRLIAEELSDAGVYSLSSAPADRRSMAPEEQPYSAFTGFLLAVMGDGVPGAGPVLGLTDLYPEVRRRMRGAGLALPEECSKTGAGAYPFVRNRAPRPTKPAPDPAQDARTPAAPAVPVRVNVPLDEAVAVAAGSDRWVEALRLVLMLRDVPLAPRTGRPGWNMRRLANRCEMTAGERLIGHATTGRTRNVAFTDSHLCLLDSEGLLRIPYARLGHLSVAVSIKEDRVVTVTDQAGISEDVVYVTTTADYGGRRLKFVESGTTPVRNCLTGCVPALIDLHGRNPGWFP
ncbi:caspase domain-containing protein [Streptomyces sp. NPDC051704]|uniref:caspase domain-containing protein n=1 Tax=Streptomyces sp. NPDC051704 TaxID=3365671 RepID=UPI00379935CA